MVVFLQACVMTKSGARVTIFKSAIVPNASIFAAAGNSNKVTYFEMSKALCSSSRPVQGS